MPYPIGGFRTLNTVATTTTTTTAPTTAVEKPKTTIPIDPRLFEATTLRNPKSTFEVKSNRGIKRTGTDDDSLGGGVQLKQKGIYGNDGIVGPDNDPVRLALRTAIWERLETPSYLRSAQTPAAIDSKKLGTALAELTTAKQATKLSKLAATKPEAAANLHEVVSHLKGLSKDVKASLLNTAAQDAGGIAGAVVANIVGSKTFAGMSVKSKTELAAVLARLDDKGLAVMGSLFENVPEALSDKDHAGGTLLGNLAQLASQPLNASLTGHTTTEELLSNVLHEVMNPNRVDQGTATTCTVASMQFELVADEPAEYARLMAGLCGPKGTVEMQGGGDLRIGPGDADERARDGRTVSQTIFQSAAMEYANGRFSNYDPILGVSVNEKTGDKRPGLKPDNQQALLEKLFGVEYSIDRLFTENEATKALAKLEGWDARGFRNRPIVVDLDQGKFNHAVTLESVSKEKIIFRDPYGVLRSMKPDAFQKVALTIHLPSDVKLNGVG